MSDVQADTETQGYRMLFVLMCALSLLMAIPLLGWLVALGIGFIAAVQIFVSAKLPRMLIDLTVLLVSGGAYWLITAIAFNSARQRDGMGMGWLTLFDFFASFAFLSVLAWRLAAYRKVGGN